MKPTAPSIVGTGRGPRATTVRRVAAALACVSVAACLRFDPPTPPVPPLSKSEAAALGKCQQTIIKAQRAFAKQKLATLQKCLDGIMKARLPFENGVTTQADFDAAIAKMRDKCTAGYAKITAASTKFVGAVIKSCTPVQAFVVGDYDALRLKLAMGGAPSLSELAGTLCTATEAFVDAQLWIASPRLIELLDYLGPDFVVETDIMIGEGFPDVMGGGFPNVPLDPRCPPIETIFEVVPTPIPTATP